MKKKNKHGFSIIVLFIGCFSVIELSADIGKENNAQSINVADDMGRKVNLLQPAQRIISLAPHITELLFELGLGSRIIATIEPTDFSPQAHHLEVIGNLYSINIERLVELQPDLIIAWYSGGMGKQINKIQALGYPVFFSEPTQLIDIANNMQAIAQLAGVAYKGEKKARLWSEKLSLLEKEFSAKRKITVFYQLSHQPMYTVNGQHFIGQAIQLCGGENIFADIDIPVPLVSLEAVLDSQPEVILYGTTENNNIAWQHHWLRFQTIPAVKHQALLSISANKVSRPSPGLLNGIKELCLLLDEYREKSQ